MSSVPFPEEFVPQLLYLRILGLFGVSFFFWYGASSIQLLMGIYSWNRSRALKDPLRVLKDPF